MYALLMAALSFNMTYLSLKTKLQVIFTKALQATKPLFGVPDFHYYTLASGLAHVFRRAPKPQLKPLTPPNTSSLSSFKKMGNVLINLSIDPVEDKVHEIEGRIEGPFEPGKRVKA